MTGEESLLAVVAQLDPRVEDPTAADLHKVGTLAKVHKTVKMPNGNVVVFVEGLQSIRIVALRGCALSFAPPSASEPRISRGHATTSSTLCERNAQDLFRDVVSQVAAAFRRFADGAMNIDDPVRLSDFIAANLAQPHDALPPGVDRNFGCAQAPGDLVRELSKEIEVLELRSKINEQVQEQVSQSQREYLLREQMKAIQKELGEIDDASG